MRAVSTTKLPVWFWVVGVIALLWNLMGLMAFVSQRMMTKESLASLPESQQKLYEATPTWVNVVFGIAVISGTLGCVGLLMRKHWAFPVFVVSFIAVLAQMSYVFIMSDTVSVKGESQMVLPVLVTVIAAVLVWYSRFVKIRNWNY